MGTIHIPESEAACDFLGLQLSRGVALAEANEIETGLEPVIDAGFADDLKEIVRNRKPRDTSAWE